MRKYAIASLVLSVVLFVAHMLYCEHLAETYYRHNNEGYDCDPALVTVLASPDYRKADEHDKHVMLKDWAEDRFDRKLGAFVRYSVLWVMLLFGLSSLFPLE